MGEQEQNSISAKGSLYSSIMRNSRGKIFVYVALLGTFCVAMFIFSRTHSNLKELEGVNQKCQQQRDSLSAQLQVVYEHKNRLEKSLQQEKSEHTHNKEECDTQHKEMEKKQQQDKEKVQALEKQLNELKTSYSQLDDDKNILERKMQEQLQSLEKQKEDEILKLQTQLNDILEEKDKLEKSLAANKMELHDHMGELNMCRYQHEQAELKLSSAREQMKKLQSLIPPVAVTPDKALGEPKHETNPRNNGETGGSNPEDLKNGHPSMSLHKDKQVLMRPNLQPPESKKSTSSDTMLKFSKGISDTNKADHSNLAKHDGTPEKMGNGKEPDDVKRKNSEQPQDQDNKLIPETNDIGGGEEHDKQGLLNHPQVQPPHNFDDGGEQELNLFHQNGMDDQKPQLERPLNKGPHFPSEVRKSPVGGFFQSNDLAIPQLQGLGEKHQGDNYVHDSHMQQPFEVPHINHVKRDAHINERMVDHADGDDDDDDQDGENEVQLMGGGGLPPKVGRFPDNDFEDQDTGDNENGAKEEEGVVVAPR